MQTFKDKNGVPWTIDLLTGEIRRIKKDSEGRFNLFEPSAKTGDLQNSPTLRDLLDQDYEVFWELLWHIVEPEAIKKGVSAEQFGLAMPASCLVAAQVIFFNEWRDFFRDLQRPDEAVALEKTIQLKTLALKKLTAKLAEVERLMPKVEAMLDRELNKSFENWEASLDSIQGDSPGESLTT